MFELHRLRLLIALALPALMAGAGLWALLQLPAGAQVPIHFDAAGHANGWAGALWGLFLLPLLAAGTLGLILLLPRIDPRAEKLRQSPRAQLNIALAVQLLLATVQALIIAIALGQQPDLGRWLLLMMGLLFAVIGNMAGKLRWNYTVGIRTPWTLANERVWDKTHRIGGKLFKAAGILALGGLFFPGLTFYFVILPILVVAIFTLVYSYLVYRKEAK